MKLLLALDGALGVFSAAAIGFDESDSHVRAASAAGGDALERGLALVENVLAGCTLSDVAMLAVTTGPGSFTGLRIALSYAKSLAFARDLPLVGVSSFDVVEPDDVTPPFAAFVSGRKGLSCARFRSSDETVVECGPDDDVAAALARRLAGGATLACAGAAEGVLAGLGERGIIVCPCPSSESPPALALARKALRRTPARNPHSVRADYGNVVYYARVQGDPRA